MPTNATTGAYPAVVTIPDLPTGTTLTGTELLEAVQTVGGIANSIQVALTQIMTASLGALPTGGGTGQVLDKASATNFAAQWVNISSLVTASSGITVAGSTAVQVSLSTAAGLSVLGVAGTTGGVPVAITSNSGLQVLQSNAGGTGLVWGGISTGMLPAGTAGWPLVGNGTAAAPTFQQVGIAAIATANPPYGFGAPINLGLAASTSGAALTISALTNALATASASSPILIPFRDATLATGDPVWRAITTTALITLNQAASIGAASSSPMRGWITAHDTGTSAILGVINCLVGMPSPTQVVPLAQHTLQSTVAISSAAVTAGIFYASGALTSRPFTILGYFEYANMTTAGQWINTPTQLQLYGPGVKKPGDEVQRVFTVTNTIASTAATTFGTSTVSAIISPTSAANLVDVEANGLGVSFTAGTGLFVTLRRGATTNIGLAGNLTVAANNAQFFVPLWIVDAPATTAPVTYAVYFATQNVGTTVSFPTNSFATPIGTMRVREIMA